MNNNKSIDRIAFIGNYLPRQCGIATFTTDLSEAIADAYPSTTCIALPVNDREDGYDYPNRVRFELNEKDIDTYKRAAEFLNINNVDIVSLQFEYGIFGGLSGSHIIALLKELRMPIVTTLHTILQNPNPEQKFVMDKVLAMSDRVISMSHKGVSILKNVYNIDSEKIDMIHHGIPDIPFVDPNYHKDLFGVEGNNVILSFGLLSPSKGFENVIKAMPKVLETIPNVVYIILGETHPKVKNSQGEIYRNSLNRIAQELSVENNIMFYNRFVSTNELINFIGAADIYITPYLNEEQITSGTLAYTVGAGKAIISTPYWYAKEMLADSRGIIVPFNDKDALTYHIIHLLEDEKTRHTIRKKAYLYGRDMIWSKTAEYYMKCFEKSRIEKMHTTKLPIFVIKPVEKNQSEFPSINLNHLKRLTDYTGIIQHSIYTIPNYSHGYCLDDNARALIISVLLENMYNGEINRFSHIYLAFLLYAFNETSKNFRNFLDYNRNWLEDKGSEDSQGRTIWALGTVIGRSKNSSFQNIASILFEKALPSLIELQSPRAMAFALLGIYEYSTKFNGDSKINHLRLNFTEKLAQLYDAVSTKDWNWFENSLNYCNAIIPHALILSAEKIANSSLLNIGLDSLMWLLELQKSNSTNGHFVPIGTDGFYNKNEEKARFDQQPIEAQSMISACLAAYKITGQKFWKKEAHIIFDWFLGRNDLNLSVYDPISGGCKDGLHSDRLNENQGAESTLAFLQSLLELKLCENTLMTLEI